MPDDFLDLWYGLEQLFLVYKGETVVGMLDLSVKEGQISNIGVAPGQRNKGYGRQIMLYGMDYLLREGCDSAHLRVSVDNAAAIHLYESLGFTVKDRINHLIWWKQ
jgi:mycothiol synthase